MRIASNFAFIFVAGALAAPVSGQHAHHGSHPGDAVDPRLTEQIDALRRNTERYRDHANAVKDGYKRFGAEGPLMGEHWYHPGLVKAPLDLNRPATLQYAQIDGKRVLVGVAYNVYQREDEALPDGFAGDSDVWHVHDVPRLARTLVAERPFLRWLVERRIERGKVGAGDRRTQLVMVHAWPWSENPDGMFARQQRALPYLRAGLPTAWASSGNESSAWGVSLARDGCIHELRRLDRLAHAADHQKQSLREGCEQAAQTVRSALAAATGADPLNRLAGEAWRDYLALRDRTLTTEQKLRLTTVMEPVHPH